MIRKISDYQIEVLKTYFYNSIKVLSIQIKDEDTSIIIEWIDINTVIRCQNIPYHVPQDQIIIQNNI